MKKFTTLALALAVSASAMAHTMQEFKPMKAVDFNTVQVVEKSAQTSAKFNKVALGEETLSTKAFPAGVTPEIYYNDPSGAFYPYNTFAVNGQDGYILPTMILPAYTNLNWYNYTYYIDATTGQPTLAVDGNTWAWTYTDFNGGEATATTADLQTINQPYALKNYPEASYSLTANGEAAYVYSGNMPIFGGNGEFLPWFAELNGVTNLAYNGSVPYNMYAEDLVKIGGTGSFGLGANEAGSGWEAWGEFYAENYGTTDFRVEAVAQVFDAPAAPYAIKSVEVYANVEVKAGAEVRFVFFKNDADGNVTGEVIKDFTYKFPEAYSTSSSGYYYPLTVDFSSVDEFGFELDYQLIDCGMTMMITGYENNAAITYFDVPIVFFADEKPTATVNPSKAQAYCSFNYNGNTAATLLEFPYIFYVDATRTSFMVTNSLHMYVDVEYPYLMTYGNYTTGESIDPAAEHKVYLKPGESAEFGLLCFGTTEEILYSTADGSDMPEWLTVELVDQELSLEGLTSKGADVLAKFTLAEGLDDTEKSCDIVLSYKGQTQTFKIAQATTGIEGIAGDVKEGAVKYYNLQGVEVANPENGLYIVRRGNTVTKEMIVK